MIKWENYPDTEATWEDAKVKQQEIPLLIEKYWEQIEKSKDDAEPKKFINRNVESAKIFKNNEQQNKMASNTPLQILKKAILKSEPNFDTHFKNLPEKRKNLDMELVPTKSILSKKNKLELAPLNLGQPKKLNNYKIATRDEVFNFDPKSTQILGKIRYPTKKNGLNTGLLISSDMFTDLNNNDKINIFINLENPTFHSEKCMQI